MSSINTVSPSTVNAASSADVGTVQGAASMVMLKKSLNMQADAAIRLLNALPKPELATAGNLGTQVNTYA